MAGWSTWASILRRRRTASGVWDIRMTRRSTFGRSLQSQRPSFQTRNSTFNWISEFGARRVRGGQVGAVRRPARMHSATAATADGVAYLAIVRGRPAGLHFARIGDSEGCRQARIGDWAGFCPGAALLQGHVRRSCMSCAAHCGLSAIAARYLTMSKIPALVRLWVGFGTSPKCTKSRFVGMWSEQV